MSVSWPLAFGGAFQTALTGYDNIRFICRVYGVQPESTYDFVESFSELGSYLHEPMRSYSSGMRARLAFAISMSVEFDCFLVDEVIAVGDSRFHEKCHHELFERRADRAIIIVSHDAHYIRNHCTRAAVLNAGRLTQFDRVDEAQDFYLSNV
jgi:capsular polysaccharide transport system ATP-binding protein